VLGLGSLVVFWFRKLFDDKHAGLPIEINMSFSSTTLFLVYLRYRKIFTAANLLQGNLIPCGWSDITTEKTKSLTNEVINLVCSILMYDLMVQLKTSDIIFLWLKENHLTRINYLYTYVVKDKLSTMNIEES
jgi:hypothetical protein